MNELIKFEFQGNAVRTIEKDGATWFVAKDIAEALGYSNASDAISKHCKGIAYRYPLKTEGLGLGKKKPGESLRVLV